ncbi:MAG: hypothetical protein ACTSRW_03040 [Candidatus Helarchaeota archaeon]
MDYLIKINYPEGMSVKDRSNFLGQQKKFDVIKIKNRQYILDREDYLEPLKQLAKKFQIDLEITQYPELPSTVKRILANKAQDILEKQEKKTFMGDIKTISQAFLLFYDMYLELFKTQRISTFNKKIEEILKNEILEDLINNAHAIATKVLEAS